MTPKKDHLYLVATASAILAALFAVILSPSVRSLIWWLLIIAACWILLLVIVGIVLLVKFSRAVQGPKSLSGTRCPSCRTKKAMQETNREFLHGNVKFNIDHYRMDYRCTACGHEQQQEEQVASN
jgi:DNA-directed RNA polymerase subunit RPC12/RpoP